MTAFDAIGNHVLPIKTWNPVVAAPAQVIDYIDLSAIDGDSKQISDVKRVLGSDAPSRARQIVKVADILLSTVRPNLNGLAMVTAELDGATASTGFTVLRANESSLSARYLYHWLKTPEFISDMVKKATGQSYPAVSDRIVFESLMPTPKFEQQRRIASILDQAVALRVMRRQALAKLDTLTQSLFLEMIGNPLTNPKSWEVRRLDELCLEVTDIDHKMPLAVEEGMPFISAKDLLDDGTLSFEDIKKISLEDFNRLARKSRPKRGDIIYSRIGVNLGKARLVEVDFDFLASYSCCTVRPNPKFLNSRFLCTFLDSPFALRQAKRGVKAIAVPDLGLSEIKSFRVPVPPMPVQDEFARQIESLSVLRNVCRRSGLHLAKSYAALQHLAFRGEL